MELITTSSKCVEAGELWPKFSEEPLRVVLKSSNEKLSFLLSKIHFQNTIISFLLGPAV